MKSTSCGLLKTPQACCHPWTNWMSIQQHQLRHMASPLLYKSIPHNLLKSRITALVHNSFKMRDGSNKYTHIKITSGKGYFIDTINPGGDNLYTADHLNMQNGGVFD